MFARALETYPDAIGDTDPLGVVATTLETSLKKDFLGSHHLSVFQRNQKYIILLTLLSSLGLSSASTRLVLGEAIL